MISSSTSSIFSSQTNFCCGCQQSININHTPATAGRSLVSRGITVLACQHRWHTLCLRLLYPLPLSTINKGITFTCHIPNCQETTDLSFIRNHLPSTTMLQDTPSLFAKTYLRPYFDSESAMETYLRCGSFEQIFFSCQSENKSPRIPIDTQIKELAETDYFRLIARLMYTPYEAFFLLLKIQIEERKDSLLHQCLLKEGWKKAFQHVQAMDITQLKAAYPNLINLMNNQDTPAISDLIQSLNASSHSFILDYWWLKEIISNEPHNEAAKQLRLAMRELLF